MVLQQMRSCLTRLLRAVVDSPLSAPTAGGSRSKPWSAPVLLVTQVGWRGDRCAPADATPSSRHAPVAVPRAAFARSRNRALNLLCATRGEYPWRTTAACGDLCDRAARQLGGIPVSCVGSAYEAGNRDIAAPGAAVLEDEA